jgi:regulator of protease activity HflC (stomatin/prohibitin superfamily)
MMRTEKVYEPDSGYVVVLAILLFIGGAIFAGVNGWIPICIILIVLAVFTLPGLITVQPNKACVLTLFGDYKGTIKNNGFFWVNPFFTKRVLSLK